MRVHMYVCGVRVRAWPPLLAPLRPAPPLALLGAPRAARSGPAPPRWEATPCAPRVQRPERQFQPLREAGRREVVREPEKPEPQPAALRRDGQRALKFVTAAANSWPQLERPPCKPRSWKARPAVPGPSALSRPQASVLQARGSSA